MKTEQNNITAQKVASRFSLFAMSNLRSTDTGVEGTIIWVSSGEFAGKDIQHGPRIKVVLGNKITDENLDESATVTIATPPVVIGTLPGAIRKQVIAFVTRNKDVLLQHWNKVISTREMLDQLQKV